MKKSRKMIALMAAMAMSASVLAGCGGSSSSAPKETKAAETEAAATEAAATEAAATEAASEAAQTEAAAAEGEVTKVDTSEISQQNLMASSGWGVGHVWTEHYYKPFLEYVKEATDGLVDYTLFTDGELVALTGELDAVRQGQCDIALSLSPFYDTARFPLSAVTGLPTTINNEDVNMVAVDLLMHSDKQLADGKTFYELEFIDNGVVAWPTPATTGYYILTTKGNEIKSADDFNAELRLRTASSAAEEYVKILGATPVSLPGSECFDALSRGALDGIIMPTDWVNLGYTDMLGQAIDAGVGCNLSYIAISTDKWNSWPEAQRQAFEDAYKAVYMPGGAGTTEYKVRDEAALTEAGGELLRLADCPDDVREKIEAATVETWYKWIDSMEAIGEPGKEAAILWRDCLIEAGGSVPEEMMSLEDYTPNAN